MSDTSTLLQATTCVCGFSALAIWCGVRLLGFNREAGYAWAWANVLFGLGSLLTVTRGPWPNLWMYMAADSLEVLGFAWLHAGLLRFLGASWPRREYALVIGFTLTGVLCAYLLGQPVLRLAFYCAGAAWLLGRSAWTTYTGLREEFGVTPSVIVAAPMALASLLQLLRGSGGILNGATFGDGLLPTPFNVVLVWAALSIALMLNFAVAGFAGARQMAFIRELTLRDALTGVMNRRAMEKLLRRELADWRRRAEPFSLVYFDLDRFKVLNDKYGHAAGDQALRHVVTAMDSACREGDTLARLGGEEFCVLLPHTGLEGARLMAERMRSKLEAAPFAWDKDVLTVTASFGVAAAASTDDTVAEILRRADEAMYEAKRSGRNCVIAAPLLDEVETESKLEPAALQA
ncbi:MAG: GGDEF domain-containing protein [Rhizobacter sp.]|nr:GGDEF domain-containing protein [Rhizobacter sp.]